MKIHPIPEKRPPSAQDLTKREWFAGMALAGWCARHGVVVHTSMVNEPSMAQLCLMAADDLIKELNKPQVKEKPCKPDIIL